MTRLKLLLIIVVIIFFAQVINVFFNPLDQVKQFHDTRRKLDLLQLQKAFEQYYKDNGSYPLSTLKDDKLPYRLRGFKADHGIVDWGDEWVPYLKQLPKDPGPNVYVYYANTNGQAYWLYASLERGAQDTQTCNKGEVCKGLVVNEIPFAACGGICNYGISSSNVSP